MVIKAIGTRTFLPPKDDLFSLIRESFSGLSLKEKSIIVITSKIVSIWQGRCIKIGPTVNKDDLIKKEADLYLNRSPVPNERVMLTIKDNTLIPTAGIDESNGNGHLILWPKDPFGSAKQIYDFIKEDYHLSEFGMIISDSHCIPVRRGTVGICVAYCGFYPLRDYRGTVDIFGQNMKMSQSDIADSLAAAAVLVMGEGREQTPIATIEDVGSVQFKDFDPKKSDPLTIGKDEDIYAPLLKAVKWQKGGRT